MSDRGQGIGAEGSVAARVTVREGAVDGLGRDRGGSSERSCDQREEDDADGRGGEPPDGRRPSGEPLTATSVEDGCHARGNE